MADLSDLNAASSAKIVGADPSTGVETYFANVTSEGELKISSFANVTFDVAVKTISSSQTLASVGVSNMTNRKSLVIFNKGAQPVYYGKTGVTTTNGIPILKDETLVIGVGQNINIYLITASSTSDVIIQEFA